jgi:hypothetical protein
VTPELNVDRDEYYEGVDLPAPFTCPALDTDEANAAAARHDLDHLERTILEVSRSTVRWN